ncbi:hypothetical protein [Peribacillus butanolivorans]|uniref:Lipoprotein n=1 Tax=Peribacillus butanolivorans TaxID=421767 RepID=A0ABM6XR00_9BACI|nr:hypothetical protein [Peribacillus butanolivorans]AXN41043.1 hypothetical protein DTO10_23470 [Peribacillus butanolivorans]
MNFRKVFNGCLVLFLVLIVSTCGIDRVMETGEVTELDLKEVKSFIADKKTGFLYVNSAYESREEEEAFYIKEIERVAEAEKIDFYIFDAGTVDKDHTELGVEQYSRTFVFYQDGEMKEELDFSDISEDDVPSEVEKFVQNVKKDNEK